MLRSPLPTMTNGATMNLGSQQQAILSAMVAGQPMPPPQTWLKLIHSVDKKEIGDVGEKYATQILTSRGHDVRLIGGNNKGFDLAIEAFQAERLRRELLV